MVAHRQQAKGVIRVAKESHLSLTRYKRGSNGFYLFNYMQHILLMINGLNVRGADCFRPVEVGDQ